MAPASGLVSARDGGLNACMHDGACVRASDRACMQSERAFFGLTCRFESLECLVIEVSMTAIQLGKQVCPPSPCQTAATHPCPFPR